MAIVLASGCSPVSTPVSVDLAEALRRDVAPRPKPIEVPSPPKPMAAATVVQPGRDRTTLRDPSRSSESDVRRAIEERQRRDYLRLVERLKEFYAADALRFEQEQLRSHSQESLAAYEKANADIRALFVEYGEKRSPLVADLALLVGFPDPNPQGKTPSVPLGNVDRQRLEQAQKLREQIQALEADFDQRVATILGQIASATEQSLADLRERIRQYRVANDERAEREAAEQVQRSVRALGLQLTERVQLTLPAVPDRVTSVSRAPAPKPAPKVTSAGVLASQKDRKMLADRQLRIWAAQNRYSIVPKGAGVKDKTEEFIAWRSSLISGR
jgi:hypothetical protein